MFRPALTRSLLLLQLVAAAVGAVVIASALRSPLSTVRADAILMARQAEDIHSLSPGSIIEREISSGKTHVYRISLISGQLFQGGVQQTGIEVAVSLVGPDGRKLEEFDEPIGENDKREILFIAKSDGEFQLIVRRARKGAAPARYRIQVETVRSATEQDQTRVRATQLMKEARQVYWKVTPFSDEELRQYAGKFEEALRLWKSLDDNWMVGETLLDLGIVKGKAGEFTQALALYEQALPLFPATPDGQVSKATNLNNMADLHYRLGETRKALDHYLQSLELKKPGRSRAISLDNIGGVYRRLGEYQLALEHHQQALATFRDLEEPRDEAVALNNIAALLGSVGDYNRSLEYLLQALTLIRKVGDKNEEAGYLYNTGNCYFSMSDYPNALDFANQSINLARAIKNSRTEADGLTLLCKVRSALGETDQALDACNQALPMHRANRDRPTEANTLSALAQIYERIGDRQKAIESRQAALALYRMISDPTDEMATLHALGELALDGGDLVSARRQIEQALEISESLRAKVGSHQLRSTYMAGLQRVYESYVDLLMRLRGQEPEKSHEQAALQFSERARARGLLDLLVEARAQIRKGADVALLEKERGLLQRLNDKDAAWRRLRNNEKTKDQAEAVAREINELTTQLQLVEAQIRSSSPRYTELAQPQPLTHEEIQRQLLDESTVLLEYALGKKQSWLWAVTPTETRTYQLPARQEIEVAARRVYELLIARQPKKGEAAATYQARVAAADRAFSQEAAALSQTLLGPVGARLEQEWKGKRLLIVAGGALEYLPFAAFPSPLSETRQESDGATGREGDGARGRQGGGTAERTTSSRPVAPSPRRPVNPSSQPLVIQSSGRPVPLIVEHEIVNLPSASALREIRREHARRQPAEKSLALIADPVFEANDPRVLAAVKRRKSNDNLVVSVRSAGESPLISPLAADTALMRAAGNFNRSGFSRLPFSREEAEEIAKFVPKSSLLKATDFQANRATAASGELSRYRILHFATHGLLNSDRPELSGLVLSLVDENGKSQDGFLRTHEIFNLDLPADIVVLSACQTALGKETKGEGLVGLTRGFMYAGAERVVASLWQVDDLATAELMKRFYRGMLRDGLRPAAALRVAQIEMRNHPQWAAPYFWASFVIQGEWR